MAEQEAGRVGIVRTTTGSDSVRWPSQCGLEPVVPRACHCEPEDWAPLRTSFATGAECPNDSDASCVVDDGVERSLPWSRLGNFGEGSKISSFQEFRQKFDESHKATRRNEIGYGKDNIKIIHSMLFRISYLPVASESPTFSFLWWWWCWFGALSGRFSVLFDCRSIACGPWS